MTYISSINNAFLMAIAYKTIEEGKLTEINIKLQNFVQEARSLSVWH